MNRLAFYHNDYCLFVLDIEDLKYYQQGNFINYKGKIYNIYKIIIDVVETRENNIKTNSVNIILK